MGTATFNGALWGARATDWSDNQESLHQPLWAAMIRAAGVNRGTQLLDIACGGDAAIMARALNAEVAGIDASQALAFPDAPKVGLGCGENSRKKLK